jgi:hypothetical protein
MSDTTDTIAGVLPNLSIKSYFSERRDTEQRTADLMEIRSGLGALQRLDNGLLNARIPELIPNLDTALSLLEQYAAESDAGQRQTLAEGAIAEADTALEGIRVALLVERNVSSAESLAYGFGALHYAILVRQSVADTVQDGPYGAPGLLASLTSAGRLLYNGSGENDVYSSLLTAIARQIEVVNIQGTSAESVVSFNIVSEFGGVGLSIEVQRLGGESDAEFEERIAAVTVQQLEVVFEEEMENIRAEFIENVGVQLTQFLSSSGAAVPGFHERIGSEAADVVDGTGLADYFSGLGGDDLYNGGAGPDAVNGGAGNDILRGGAFQDVLVGGAGNDVIFGNTTRADTADGDVARFSGLASEHTILGGTDYAVVIGPDGSRDKVFDVSYLRFDDGDITLQAGNALATGTVPFDTLNKTNFDTGERVALLYEAALNRNGAIDLPGLNFYIDVTERDNLSDEFLAADLMTSPEFTANFGDANTLSNQAFLEQIYLNVLDRPSDAAGLEFYLGLLNDGTISKALALADIAVSPENTNGSAEILQSLYETTAPEIDAGTGLAIDWSFVS